MNRRRFLQSSAVAVAVGVSSRRLGARPRKAIDASRMTVGALLDPERVFGQNLPAHLDAMQELAGVNTVLAFTHRHVSRQWRPGFEATRAPDGKEVTSVWVRTDPKYYDHPALQGRNPQAKYNDYDFLDALYPETRSRGMRLYARILEPYVITGLIPGFEAWREVDARGQPTNHVCLNNPGYIRYWESVLDDLFNLHPYLEGFKFGQERGGPVAGSLGGEGVGKCFCPHCEKLARDRGLDVRNAREGFLALNAYAHEIRNGHRPVDGNFTTFVRLLARYPEILRWEQFWMDSREDQRRRMFRQIKKFNPACRVGWHLEHGMTWDLFRRATSDYSKLAPHSDWLSVALYLDAMGRRSLRHFDSVYKQVLFGDAREELAYAMFLSIAGYDPGDQPPLAEQRRKETAFSASYVRAECQRVVAAVKRTTEVHARIGFDLAVADAEVSESSVRSAVREAFKTGVDGFWVGREWDELKPASARAYGDALRDCLKGQ